MTHWLDGSIQNGGQSQRKNKSKYQTELWKPDGSQNPNNPLSFCRKRAGYNPAGEVNLLENDTTTMSHYQSLNILSYNNFWIIRNFLWKK